MITRNYNYILTKNGIVHLLMLFVMVFVPACLNAQTTYKIANVEKEHLFSYQEIAVLKDESGKLTFTDITTPKVAKQFTLNHMFRPKYNHPNSVMWYRFRISHPENKQNWVVEFYDQTIDDLTTYAPTVSGKYQEHRMGDKLSFNKRDYSHKNFSIDIDNNLKGEHYYYVRIQSSQPAYMLIVLKSVRWYMAYALEEYFIFGIFYGMIIFFSLYNLLMFISLRQIKYLYYVIFNISIGLYEMSTDGIAFQYFWQNSPAWNQYAYGVFLFLASVFSLLFAKSFLNLKEKSPRLNKVFNGLILLRTLFFLTCLIFSKSSFIFKFIEIVPLVLILGTGLYMLFKDYKPARFFVIGYIFLLIGFLIKVSVELNISLLPLSWLTHYSLSFCFIMEMIFVSYSISDGMRLLKKEGDETKNKLIEQLQYNEKLKDDLNKELEVQVKNRTREIIERSDIIMAQVGQLESANMLLKEQSEEILRMNKLLEQDKEILETDIKEVTRAHLMDEQAGYKEFVKIYPDEDSCYRYLVDLKWSDGFSCARCGGNGFSLGATAFSRRCQKCDYVESVIANTFFQSTHIPIHKAFYLLFLIYSSKGKISSYKLSKMLELRQSTCWSYSHRVRDLMEERKKEFKYTGEHGWNKLILQKYNKSSADLVLQPNIN